MAKAPGKAYRKGITLKKMLKMFPDDQTAEQWFIKQRWPNGMCCPICGSTNVQSGCKHKTMPYRCREKECGKKFSVKTGTVMECAKVGYQDWLIGAFLLMTSLKSVSSMKLHRDIGVTQKTAWFLAQRLRVALYQDSTLFAGPVEVDETYFGGKRKNMSKSKRKELDGRGPVGKTAVVGAKDRATNQVAAQVVHATDQGRYRDSWKITQPPGLRSTPTMQPPMTRSRSITPRSSTRSQNTSGATCIPTASSPCGRC